MLLNTDYKLQAKTLAQRIQNTLLKIINGDQTHALPGQRTAETLRLIRDMVAYCNDRKVEVTVRNLNLQKAYDSSETRAFYSKSDLN